MIIGGIEDWFTKAYRFLPSQEWQRPAVVGKNQKGIPYIARG